MLFNELKFLIRYKMVVKGKRILTKILSEMYEFLFPFTGISVSGFKSYLHTTFHQGEIFDAEK